MKDDNIIRVIYSYTYQNRKLLKRYKNCTCIYCGANFHYTKINSWVNDTEELTAICPKCGIDSVVPTKVKNKVDDYTLTEELRINVKKLYF